jgi:hypothetical protein
LSTGIQEARFRQLVQQYLGLGADTLSQARHLMQSLDLENYLMNKVLFVPQIRTVHSISQYVDNVDQFIDSRHSIVFSGGQMIDLLFRLQHPSYDARADKEKFNKIIQFLRDITQNETVSLEVPHDRSSILVNMDGKTLPLHNLGTGIEEILIMAAASLGFADKIVCIEEPELHIHLSASEETVGEFIELLRLNRFSSIVIDSDKKSEQSEINQTKQRLVREIEVTKGVAWVTTGREIENELQKDVFEAACAKINQPSGADLNDRFSDRLVRADDPAKQIDKIRLARAATTLTMSVPDSAVEPIQKLVEFIKSATLKSV